MLEEVKSKKAEPNMPPLTRIKTEASPEYRVLRDLLTWMPNTIEQIVILYPGNKFELKHKDIDKTLAPLDIDFLNLIQPNDH
jgi:hypothetical protein